MPEIEILDSKERVAEVDRGKMLSVVEQIPEMIDAALKLPLHGELSPGAEIKQVIVAGMGGSAISGELAADLFPAQCPIVVNRNYNLPQYVGSETVLIALSYSGETEETLSAVRQAESRGARIICVTGGGKLNELAAQKGWPLVLVPTGFQPRAALPYLLIPLLSILGKLGVIPPVEAEIAKSLPLIKKLRDEYGENNPARSNPAKQLAKKVIGRVPVIFGATGTTGAIATRIKNQFNENTKSPAFASVFPEVNHNETASFFVLQREKHNFALIVLRDEADNERVKKRIEITKSLISPQFGGAIELVAQGKSVFARAMSLIMLGDFASVYAAISQGIDPTTIEAIVRLKKEMSR